jgi:uncharacterized protein YdeI (YjbR/CyaY-like superfamily)
MNTKNPKVDSYLQRIKTWQRESKELRAIILSCGLTEEFKWGHPCYTFQDSNIVLIHGFKEYCALLFFKGALFNDPKGILIQQTKNVQAARQIRFTSTAQIAKMKPTLKSYIHQAIKIEKAGLQVELKKTEDYAMPDELQQKLQRVPALKTAFEALTPGRQRAYIYYFSSAKQSKTREARIEKHMDQILDGLGLDD